MKFKKNQKVQWVEKVNGVVLRNIPLVFAGDIIGFNGNKYIISTLSGKRIEKHEKDLKLLR